MLPGLTVCRAALLMFWANMLVICMTRRLRSREQLACHPLGSDTPKHNAHDTRSHSRTALIPVAMLSKAHAVLPARQRECPA